MPLPIGESPGKPESPAGFLAALQVDADLSRHHVIRMQLEGDWFSRCFSESCKKGRIWGSCDLTDHHSDWLINWLTSQQIQDTLTATDRRIFESLRTVHLPYSTNGIPGFNLFLCFMCQLFQPTRRMEAKTRHKSSLRVAESWGTWLKNCLKSRFWGVPTCFIPCFEPCSSQNYGGYGCNPKS